MGTQAPCEKAVTVGHGENVVPSDSVSSQTTRHALIPYSNVLAGVTHDRGIARGSGRRMDTDDFTLWSSLQLERIVITQVGLRGKGQLCDVVDGLDVIGNDIHLL